MKKRIILVGKAASGKDYLRKLLEDRGYVYAISYTSRPPRTGELFGKDYNFMSREQFQEMIDNNEFYEYVEFNGWFYGTSKAQMDGDADIFIMTPSGLAHLKEKDRNESLIIYLDMPMNVRYERLSHRGDVDKVDRRIAADEEDFKDFKDFDVRIFNPGYSAESLSYLSYFFNQKSLMGLAANKRM